jgi:hypothetical protein
MRFRSLARTAIAGLASAVLGLLYPAIGRADLTVDKGYDLFQTDPTGTVFVLGGTSLNFMGVPLGTSNTLPGTPDVGLTDTIVQRISDVTAPAGGTGSTSIQIVGLQLESVAVVDLTPFGGAGFGHIFATLNPNQTTGTMHISFDPTATVGNIYGTFTSDLPVNADLRAGSIGATPFATASFTLSNLTPTPWTYVAPTGSVLIDGIDHNLNGTDDTNDFWPGVAGPLVPGSIGGYAGAGGPPDSYGFGESSSRNDESHFIVAPKHPVPEPTALTNLAIAGLLGLGYSWRRRRKVAAAA